TTQVLGRLIRQQNGQGQIRLLSPAEDVSFMHDHVDGCAVCGDEVKVPPLEVCRHPVRSIPPIPHLFLSIIRPVLLPAIVRYLGDILARYRSYRLFSTDKRKGFTNLNMYVSLYSSMYIFSSDEMSLMQKIIGVTELQRRFRSIFDEVTQQHVPYVLTRGSRPEAVLISYEAFLRYQEMEEQQVLDRFDQLVDRLADQNAAHSEEEIAADVAATRAALAGE
ncbi:MAG: type II toxin-antitoxin system Phd/YefM family antitoxin, partial [Anaerolineales bacterium]|nr:type II toxin-antitoxin system Phd/YefM family antitoxin [Anaerolineales bacterium]